MTQLQDLGAQGDAQNACNKRQSQQLIDDYNKYDANREQILGNPQKRFLKKMEKIEELTLYLLQLDERMEKLKK